MRYNVIAIGLTGSISEAPYGDYASKSEAVKAVIKYWQEALAATEKEEESKVCVIFSDGCAPEVQEVDRSYAEKLGCPIYETAEEAYKALAGIFNNKRREALAKAGEGEYVLYKAGIWFIEFGTCIRKNYGGDSSYTFYIDDDSRKERRFYNCRFFKTLKEAADAKLVEEEKEAKDER